MPWTSWALLLAAGALALHPLTISWDTNPDYSFGWFIPIVSLILFYERWPNRPPRQLSGLKTGLFPLLLLGGLAYFALRMAAEVGPDWRVGLWLITGLYVVALAAWLWIYGGIGWLRHFAFPICFLFFCVPWLFQIEYPLVQFLMRLNAFLVATTLSIVGIPAHAAGNIIQLPHCQLGVEEACSGILSLQASLILGVLLGDVYRLSARHRGGLILIAVGFALLGNYCRMLFLGLMANGNGVKSVDEWHDTAGYAIPVFTGIGTWLVIVTLFPKSPDPAPVPRQMEADLPACAPQTALAQRLALWVLLAALLSEGTVQGWFAWRESSLTHYPEWTATFPPSSKFKPVALSETTLDALLCDSYQAGRWQDANGWDWTSFWFRYKPKPSNRIVLGWHNPTKCLPSVGLIKTSDYPDFTATVNGLRFNVQASQYRAGETPVYVFWLIYPTSGRAQTLTESQKYELSAKLTSHLQDILDGNRGVGIETLETVVAGPKSFEEARSGYVKALETIALPDAPPGGLASGATH